MPRRPDPIPLTFERVKTGLWRIMGAGHDTGLQIVTVDSVKHTYGIFNPLTNERITAGSLANAKKMAKTMLNPSQRKKE